MSGCGLRKEMLTFEPVRMVNVKQKHEEVQGLCTFHFSNLDLVYDYYTVVGLFFDGKNRAAHGSRDTDDPASKLGSALEELLQYFPVAAGRLHIDEITGRYEVKYRSEISSSRSSRSMENNTDSTSYGLPFIVARANVALSTLGDVTDPAPSWGLLYPDMPKRNHNNHPPPPVVVIQVTTFACGSFHLAIASCHMLFDGYAVGIFVKNLCSIAKGAGLVSPMDLTNRREILKPRVPPSPKATNMLPHIHVRERSEIRAPSDLPFGNATRFSISAAALEVLRSRASTEGNKCSRVQAVIALLWILRAKCAVSSGAAPDAELPLRFPINVRSSQEFPALTDEYMGIALVQCVVRATMQELCESSLAIVVQKIRASMVRGAELQERVQSEIDYVELQLQNGRVPDMDHGFLGIPCVVNLPFYGADCGWGRPIYFSRPARQLGRRICVLEDPLAGRWNVHVVLDSQEEFRIFEEEFTKCNNLYMKRLGFL